MTARLSRTEKAVNTGYAGLLNLAVQPHHTVFLHDFDLPEGDIELLHRQLYGLPTRVSFVPVQGSLSSVLDALSDAGVEWSSEYVSLQGVVAQHRNVQRVIRLYEKLPRRDLARLELPEPRVGFKPEFASHLLRILANADYAEQQRIAGRFYSLLRTKLPYRVNVRTSCGELDVEDTRGWIDAAGRLAAGENRIMPAGEVAYAGDRVNGSFMVDGAILPSPQNPAFAKQAAKLRRETEGVWNSPLVFEIENGRVHRISGKGDAARAVSRLIDRDNRYREVTEVGISFNRACNRFIYDWPAASNESRPGVHIAIGGDASPDVEDSEPLIHLDCMAANVAVTVNGHPFLRASS